MIQWTKKTEDQMPEEGKFILMWHTVLGCQIGKYVKKTNSWRATRHKGAVKSSEVSHWAYINRPEKESVKDE